MGRRSGPNICGPDTRRNQRKAPGIIGRYHALCDVLPEVRAGVGRDYLGTSMARFKPSLLSEQLRVLDRALGAKECEE